MRRIEEAQALQLAEALLVAAGMRDGPARVVARHLVDASLRGVDGHGLARLPRYLTDLAEGRVEAAAQPEVAWVHDAIMQVTGKGGLGIPALQLAAERLGPLAHERGIAAAAVVDVGHTGRIGRYVESLAQSGCFAFAFGGGGYQQGGTVAPHGGRDALLGTNPYAMALPGGALGPVVVDFATATLAEGKLALAKAHGTELPDESVLDAEGQPTRSAADFYQGGAILPAAGPKGYGMALIAELIGCALIGRPKEFNWLLVALDLARFRTPSAFAAAAEDCLQAVKAVPPRDGFDSVALPGELERAILAERRAQGLPLDAVLEAALSIEASRLGIAIGDFLPEAAA
ncbi:MAG: Ldh family oxidoreductase [Pseudomonadota bacterium]